MTSGIGQRRRAVTLLLIVLPIVFVAAAATSVTVTSSNYADRGGAYLQPYFENANPPISGCSSPCLQVDSQTAAPNPTSGTLTLDSSATATWSSGTSFSINATTSKANDVIVLWIVTNLASISITVASVSDTQAKVQWQSSARFSFVSCSGTQETTATEWYGISPSILSTDPVTIGLSGTPSSASAILFSVTGADTALPFDSNSALPKDAISACTTTTSAPTVSGVSTKNQNDFVFSLSAGYTSVTQTAGTIGSSSATKIKAVSGTGHSAGAEYEIVSSTIASSSCSFGTSTTYWGALCDAIVQASGSFTLPAGASMYLWSPQYGASTAIPAGSLSIQIFASPPPPGLDSSASGVWTIGSSMTISSLSTTGSNDLIVLSIITSDGSSSITVNSVSDSQGKIAWQSAARSSASYCSSTQKSYMIEWYGVASSRLSSDSVSIALSGTPVSASAIAVAISGEDTVTPFDPYSTLPKGTTACSATGSAPSVGSVSTYAGTDLVFALFGGYSAVNETAGAIGSSTGTIATSVVGLGDNNVVEYTTTTSALSSSSCKFGTSTTYWKILCDAVMPARMNLTISFYITNSSGTILSTLIASTSATVSALDPSFSLATTSGVVPASGYVFIVITGPSSPLTVYWGNSNPTLFEVEYAAQA